MKNIKQRQQLLNICNEIESEIINSDNTEIQKKLAFIAIVRMKHSIMDEITNANSFLKLHK